MQSVQLNVCYHEFAAISVLCTLVRHSKLQRSFKGVCLVKKNVIGGLCRDYACIVVADFLSVADHWGRIEICNVVFFPRESLVQVYIFRFDSHLWNGEETFTTSSKDYPLGGILPRGKFPQNSDPRQGPLYLARRNTKHCVCQWVKKYRLLMNSYIVRIMRYLQTFVSSTLNVFSFNVQVDTNYLMPPFFEDSRIWHLLTLVINWHRFDTYCCHLHVKWKNVNE